MLYPTSVPVPAPWESVTMKHSPHFVLNSPLNELAPTTANYHKMQMHFANGRLIVFDYKACDVCRINNRKCVDYNRSQEFRVGNYPMQPRMWLRLISAQIRHKCHPHRSQLLTAIETFSQGWTCVLISQPGPASYCIIVSFYINIWYFVIYITLKIRAIYV